MKEVFVDSLYWIALTNPGDQWHRKAVAAKERRPEVPLVTTEDVLVEYLTYFGAHGPEVRRAAAREGLRSLHAMAGRILYITLAFRPDASASCNHRDARAGGA